MNKSFNLTLLIVFWLGLNMHAQPISVSYAQKKLDSMQNLPQSSYKEIEERKAKLENGDAITTSVFFYDTVNGYSLTDYMHFLRRYGLTTKSGKKLKPVFEKIDWLEDDRYLVKFQDNDRYINYLTLLNRDFKVLKVYLEEGSEERFYSVEKNRMWGVVDGSLNIVVPFDYTMISALSLDKEYEIVVKERKYHTYAARLNTLWGLITSENDVIIAFDYQFLSTADRGRVVAKKNNKWGIIDLNGYSIVPLEYDSITPDYSNYFLLKEGKWGKLNYMLDFKSVKFQFDEIAFNPGRCEDMARIGKKWYFILEGPFNSTAPGYDDFYFHADAGSFVGLRQGQLWGIFDCSNKKFVTDIAYTAIIDVKYERGQIYSNGQLIEDYPIRHFRIKKPNGTVEDLLLRD